jgi:UDP-3-O-[3-hydroxymyristoyl] glucosamine N-acyltransferase
MSLNLQQLAEALHLEFQGAPDLVIKAVASPESAAGDDLCFMHHKKYLAEINASKCGAVILSAELAPAVQGKALLIADNPQYSYVMAIKALGLEPPLSANGNIHPSAQVADSARLGEGVTVGACVVIEDDVHIGAGTLVGAGSIIERSVFVGKNCHLHPRVTLEHEVKIGDRCILHPGVVIGADGFGLVMHEQQWHKIPQLGTVMIGDDVEIGANTAIDRGALGDTVIEQGCKIDNLVHVGHNVRIGAHTAIAGCVGIAGSTSIGRYCQISGAVAINGHVSLVDHVTITGMTVVTKDIRQPGVYSSGTPMLENKLWHRNNARYKSLDELAKTVARLDKSTK